MRDRWGAWSDGFGFGLGIVVVICLLALLAGWLLAGINTLYPKFFHPTGCTEVAPGLVGYVSWPDGKQMVEYVRDGKPLCGGAAPPGMQVLTIRGPLSDGITNTDMPMEVMKSEWKAVPITLVTRKARKPVVAKEIGCSKNPKIDGCSYHYECANLSTGVFTLWRSNETP